MRLRRLAAAALCAATLAFATLSPAHAEGGAGDLRIGNFLDLRSWDPALTDIGFAPPYLSAVYDPLVSLEPDGTVVPVLATGWEWSADGLSLSMTLREGVSFHDGTPFDAAAAVTVLEHLRVGTLSQDAYGSVSAIEATGPHAIRITLSERDDAMLYLMGTGRSYMVSPAALAAGTLATTPSGSGPYVLDAAATVPGSAYHFTKVLGHWDTDRYPWDRVVISPMLDPTARQNAMLSGQLEVIYGNPNDMDQARAQGWNIGQSPASWVGMQITDRTGGRLAALGDIRVRQALAHAFDGAGIMQAFSAGAGELTNQVFMVGGPVNDPALNDAYPLNVERARALMAEAGFADGIDITLPVAPIFALTQSIADQTLRDIGFRVTWDQLQMPDYQRNAPTYPMFFSFLALDSNPMATLRRQVTGVQWYNPMAVEQLAAFPELNTRVQAALAATGDEQIAALRAVNEELVAQAWWPLWYQAYNNYFSVPTIEVQGITGMMFPQLRHIRLR